jgi:hypothetical protein
MDAVAAAMAGPHDLVGLWVFPNRVGSREGLRVPAWYLATFGIADCLILAGHAVRTALARLHSGCASWDAVARRHGVPLHRCPSPDSPAVAEWVRDLDVDVVVSTVGHVLSPELVRSPRLGMVAKHASILPGCRGLFPYLWSRIDGHPPGVSLFVMDAGVDTGPILLRRRYVDQGGQASMLRFYMDVFHAFPAMLILALDEMRSGRRGAAGGVLDSYHGLPDGAAVRRFRSAGNRIARASDLLYRPERQWGRFVEDRQPGAASEPVSQDARMAGEIGVAPQE